MLVLSRYTVAVGVIGIIAQYITIPLFSEKFKFRDSTIVIIDITGCFFQTLIIAFATAEWMLYVGACVAFLDATSFTMIRLKNPPYLPKIGITAKIALSIWVYDEYIAFDE